MADEKDIIFKIQIENDNAIAAILAQKEAIKKLKAEQAALDLETDEGKKANEAYNAAIGTLKSRVLVSARRFKELGAATGAEIPLLEPVETQARDINLPDVQADRPDA